MVKHFGAQILKKVVSVAARRLLGTITHFETDDNVAALTFDDGPHPEFTPRLLDVLKKHQARATFFMLGEAAAEYPGIVRSVAQGGHAVGNHSWDHPSFVLINGRERRRQIRACASAIAPYNGLRLFRSPYGHQNMASRVDALWLRHQVIMFNVVAEDWLDRDAEWMANSLVTKIRPGSIVLLHDAIKRSVQAFPQQDRQPMLEAVEMTLERLRGKFRFITIPELFRCGRPQRQNWYHEPEPKLMPQLHKHPLVAKRLRGSKSTVQ